MSQQWHEHLANLTWWEQIDKFFFPSKYSCTTTANPIEALFSAFLVICIIIFIVGLIIHFKAKEAKKHVN